MVQAGFLQVDRFVNILHRSAMVTLLAEDLRSSFQNIFSCHAFSLPNGRLTSEYDTVPGFACQGSVQ